MAGLADAVIGHTAGKVYPFLQGMRSVLEEVRDEATADQIIQQIKAVRGRAKTVVDQRALDLLEALVERRAAEVQNQPGPHVNNALAAMQRAFKGTWSVGEPRLMVDLLADLGKISQPALAQDQLREADTLYHEQAKGTADRLYIGVRLAGILHTQQRTNDALAILQSALKEHQDAHGGRLPVLADDALTLIVSFLEETRHYAEAEQVLLDQLKHPVHQQQAYWLAEQLYGVYNQALYHGGTVSLGSGKTLYQAAERKLLSDLEIDDQNHRYQLIHLLCALYGSADRQKIEGYKEDLRGFAFNLLPTLLRRQTLNCGALVNTVAQTVRDRLGPRDGIAFLLDRIEHEPSWYRYSSQDSWNDHAGLLAMWRESVKDLGDLEPRLVQFVIRELRRDLESRQQRNRLVYDRRFPFFWPQKVDIFVRAAEEVLARHSQSSGYVEYIAAYLHQGLNRTGRATEILLTAHRQKVLEESGQRQLITYLQDTRRYAESVALLEPLLKARPEDLYYRIWLMAAYFHTQRPTELLSLLKDTDTFFHKDNRWGEGVLAELAKSCVDNQLYAQAVAYYKELIPLHEKSHPRRGIGNGTLSAYYSGQAQAYAGLHDTPHAVEAAAGAVVAWDPRQDLRQAALDTLKQVLASASDLDAYAASLDKQNEQMPIVRKALGLVYFDKSKFTQAIAQLRVAAELQPNDTETHQKLIACYDKLGDQDGAIRQLLQSLQLSRRDLKLYQDLGRRYEKNHESKETERAYTSIVEVLPSEAESHALLAEIREAQNRWREAIAQWDQAARLRALEPTDLVRLAAAQIHERRWDDAADTLRRLKSRSWPARFDVNTQMHDLEKKLEQGRKQ